MKLLVGQDIGSYSFSPGLSNIGTVTLTLPYSIKPEQLLLVTNVTDGIILYNFADSSAHGSFNNGVLTLLLDTSSMSSSDSLQIYIDVPTEENIYEIEPIQEKYTYDTNLSNVLGTKIANDGLGNIQTKSIFQSSKYQGILRNAQDEFSVNCEGYQTAAIQLSSTWAGTVTFEVNVNGGDYLPINGFAINSPTAVSGSTTNGIYRFSVSALTRIRARFSAYTSGACTVAIVLSAGEAVVSTGNVQRVQGSQGQDISQRATTFESNTFDTNLSNVLGNTALWRNGFTGLEFAVAPTINPAQPATYPSNQFAQYPQIFPRLRVESAGSQKLPFAQEANTNQMLVSNPSAVTLLEQILIQLTLLNNNYAALNNMPLPLGQTNI